MSVTKRYEKLLLDWIENAKAWVAEPFDNHDLAYYGTGTNVWGIQTHMKGFSAFATACELELPEGFCYTKAELIETSLKMLRFTLESHMTGSYHCTDSEEEHWGHHWLASLATERMMHGIEALEPYLTDRDRQRIREVFTSEANYLTDDRKLRADPVEPNVPESNLWKGAFLHRTAIMYPDSERVGEWKEFGTALLLNSISVPSDKLSEVIYAGKPEREWNIGANFFESYALHHHGYMNVGYMVICLSNIAMLHFSLKRAGIAAPPELYHHFHELWQLVRSCIFDDGRLWRIGGDTRVRYCYCQDYLTPVFLLAADLEGEDMSREEEGWVGILETETAHNGDGSFLSDRLELFRERSPLYYTRLEADRACTISMVVHWYRTFGEIKGLSKPTKEKLWDSGDYHGSYMVRNSERLASFTWVAAELPSGSIVPASDSSMHEARHNLASMIEGGGLINSCKIVCHEGRLIESGFITGGQFDYVTSGLLEENDITNTNARNDLLFCALPDGKTVVTLQLCRALRRCWLTKVEPLNLMMPNDIFNGEKRDYRFTDSRHLVIDSKLGVMSVYGKELSIERGEHRSIGLQHISLPKGMIVDTILYSDRGMLKVDKVLVGEVEKCRWFDRDEAIFDFGALLVVGEEFPTAECFADGLVRAVRVHALDGRDYVVAADFGSAAKAVVFGREVDFGSSRYQVFEV